jgi:hypothetical protein
LRSTACAVWAVRRQHESSPCYASTDLRARPADLPASKLQKLDRT